MKYTINKILKSNINKFKNKEYIYEKINGTYISHTYEDFYNDVLKVASLLQKNHNSKDRIIIYAENSYNYMVTDAAIMGYTCISVTISKEWNSYDLENSIEIIKPKTIIYSNQKEEVINKLKKKYKKVNYINIETIIPTAAILKINSISIITIGSVTPVPLRTSSKPGNT